MRGPKLPSRDRKNDSARSQAGQGPTPPPLGQAQQLSTNPVFKQFVDQPDKLLAVLQQDHVLANAAANSPDIAALLDPNTLRQALAVLQGSPDDPEQQQQQQGAPAVQRKALMQLQNYALQLQQAKAAGGGPVLPLQVQSAPAFEAAGSLHEGGAAAGGVAGGSMWAALQQRLNKFQQRSSVLGAAVPGGADHGNPSSPFVQQQQQQAPNLSSPWTSAQVQQQQQQQLLGQQGQQTPQQEPPLQPQQPHPVQHSRPKDAASRALLPHGSSGSSGSPAASPRMGVRLARLAMPDGSGGSSGRVMSPLGWAASPSAAGLGTSSSTLLSPGSMAALQRRSSSSLSHRLLRHSAASPLDLTDLQRSGSQALNVEQLESGDVIVDITPPTRVTQELSWSTDPAAAYVLDAASSGSFSQLPASDSSTHLPVSTLAAAAAATPSSSSMVAAAPAGAGPAAGPAAGGAFAGFAGPEDSGGGDQTQTQQLYALPLLGGSNSSGGSEVAPASTQAAGDASTGSGKGYDSQVSAAAGAAASTACAAAAGGRRSSNSNRQRASPQKLLLRVVRQEQQGGGSSRAQPQSQPQQQQQLTEERYSYIDLSDPVEQTAALASKQALEQQFQQQQLQQQQYQQQHYQQQQQGYDAAAGTALAGARAAAAAGGSLDARTYYEAVAPSTWRPTDVGSAPGDYLELYRRAYCSYADALFPPLWMALLGTLATLQLMPLWQICLLGLVTFWGGLWLMAIKWAGVPASQLGLSRVTPVLTVCLELTCTGAFITQVLPVMWLGHSLLCTVLLVSSCATMALHLTAYLQDPGYTPLPDAEEGSYAAHLRPSASSSSKRSTDRAAGNGQVTGADAAASESTPLLRSQQQQQPAQAQAGSSAAGSSWGGTPMDQCWTCRVKRNLRSKHCPLCKRCVERFDHHCPVLGNCVGAGNHKTFVAFLALMLLSQLLFCHLTTSMLTQAYLLQLPAPYSPVGAAQAHSASLPSSSSAQRGSGEASQGAAPGAAVGSTGAAGAAPVPAAAGVAGESSTAARVPLQQQQQQQQQQGLLAGDSAGGVADGAAAGVDADAGGTMAAGGSHHGWWSTLQALWAAGSTHMGLVLLLLAQVPTMFMSGFLLFRALGLAAANLTVNEWMNRQRYVHLHYTGAGFSNRFDRGVGANCYDFWCGPKRVDYWQSWEAGEQEMQRKGMTLLVPWSPTTLIRYWDLRWAQYQQRLMSSRARRKELQMHRRMLALGLPSQA